VKQQGHITIIQLRTITGFHEHFQVVEARGFLPGVTEFVGQLNNRAGFQMGAHCYVWMTDEGNVLASVSQRYRNRDVPHTDWHMAPSDRMRDYYIEMVVINNWQLADFNIPSDVTKSEHLDFFGFPDTEGAVPAARTWVREQIHNALTA